MLMRKYHVESM